MNKLDYILLIHKKLSNEINAEELKALELWMAKAENQQTAKAIEDTWQVSELFGNDLDVNIENGLKRAKSKFTFDQEVIPTVKIEKKVIQRSLWNIRNIAAAVALLLGFVFLFQLSQSNSNEMINIATLDNQTKTVSLSDGSIVTLNENSQLFYPAEFGATRNIQLTGEAFFEIQKNPAKPFIVATNETKVEVLGTSFNVRAYEHEDQTAVHVHSGKVAFTASEEKIDLAVADKAIYEKATKKILKNVDKSYNSSAWKTKRLKFVTTPINEVISLFESHYDIEIELSGLDNCIFNGFHNISTIEEMFETLKAHYECDIIKTDNKHYQLSGGNCK